VGKGTAGRRADPCEGGDEPSASGVESTGNADLYAKSQLSWLISGQERIFFREGTFLCCKNRGRRIDFFHCHILSTYGPYEQKIGRNSVQ
jgi:hypothetical protein